MMFVRVGIRQLAVWPGERGDRNLALLRQHGSEYDTSEGAHPRYLGQMDYIVAVCAVMDGEREIAVEVYRITTNIDLVEYREVEDGKYSHRKHIGYWIIDCGFFYG